MKDAILALLLIVLLVLQFSNKRLPRVVVTLAVIALSVVVVGTYQIELYVCNSEQRAIASMFRGKEPTDDFSWAINAANRYWSDKENYTGGEPNYRSYCSYLQEEPNTPSVDYD